MSEKMNGAVVIIPAYEPPREFIDYAREVSSLAEALIVVNDGSGPEFDRVFDEIAALPNVTYISYGENHGKGYALKTAFRHCADSFPDEYTMITADCDGQHKVEDIVKVYRASRRSPGAIVLGSRNFTLPNVPKRSLAGNTNIRWIYRFLYGLDIYDTQTGLRAFSVSMAEELCEIRGDRFEYEMGVLIQASKHKTPVIEIPITTVYPDDPKEHVSHFKTIRDSVRMLGVVLKNLNWYLLSSAISAVVDVATFFILTFFFLDGTNALQALVATVSARVISSIFNFTFNFKYVFGGKRKSAVLRYYTLWLCQLGASYGMVVVFGRVLGLDGALLTLLKGLWDLILAFFSYSIQRAWVFADRESGVFYSPLGTMAIAVARRFSKKYRSAVLKREKPCIYVCRHLDMHGPYTTLKWIGFDVHPMMFNPFFNTKDCYEQFAGYTFTEREGKQSGGFNLKAWLASRFVPAGARVVKAIPVYRKSAEVVKTFRASMKCLLRNESIIVYPDVAYTSREAGEPEIYEGFLYLGGLYKKRTGESLSFIPLYIDEENWVILEGDPVTCDSFEEDRERAVAALRRGLSGDMFS